MNEGLVKVRALNSCRVEGDIGEGLGGCGPDWKDEKVCLEEVMVS